MKKQKALAKKEELEQVQKIAEDAGMTFVDHELPPEEVDEEEVRRTLKTSLLSMVPYTNEWYEARAAEDEMDDLKKIRIERVKADDQMAMAKTGRYEEALEEMMSETNYDFFYFNKLRHRMEQEGRYKFEGEEADNAFSLFSRGPNRNRLKKAINAVFGALDEETTKELARLSSLGSTNMKKFDRNQPCTWRGKNRKKETMRCENKRAIRNLAKSTGDQESVGSVVVQKEPEVMPFCVYHLPHCLSDLHQDGEQVRIRIPNGDALCSECYMLKKRSKPPALTADICPGVIPQTGMSGMKSFKKLTSADGEESEIEKSPSSGQKHKTKQVRSKKRVGLCQWLPSADDFQKRGYECCNKVFMDPLTQLQTSLCMWHATTCIRAHPVSSNNVITIPNQHALCSMHYLAEHGTTPPTTEFPFPGMKERLGRDFWKTARARHWGIPDIHPPKVIIDREYYEPEPPEDLIQRAFLLYNHFLFNRRKKREGNKAALKIQTVFRKYKKRNIHRELKYRHQQKRRFLSTVLAQASIRRFLAIKAVRKWRELSNRSTLTIQRVYRGYYSRLLLYIDWAAKRIQRFMRLLHFFKFKDAVIMVMQLRRIFKHRSRNAIELQRCFRGYSARAFIFNLRLQSLIQRAMARLIQKNYREARTRWERARWRPPEEQLKAVQGKRLSRLILRLYGGYLREKRKRIRVERSIVAIQKLLRGIIARKIAKRLRRKRAKIAAVPVEEKREPHNPLFIRRFLPRERQSNFEVDVKTFEPALIQWYEAEGVPLLHSEKDGIIKRFKNPINGSILVRQLDLFIFLHKMPCRKHGRKVCGLCVYRRSCMIHNCRCERFKTEKMGENAICQCCNHPGTLHSLCPLQVKKISDGGSDGTKEQQQFMELLQQGSMLDILTADRQPDMSRPTAVNGVAITDVLVPELDPDELRTMVTKRIKLEKQSQRFEATQSALNRTLGKSLALCEVDGEKMHKRQDYWGQQDCSVVKLGTTMDGLDDTAIFDQVTTDVHPPNYDIPMEAFWPLTAKNPNKTVRDYHEKFSHNMPVPVVSGGQVVYTFEGSQVYFNIVNQIIRLEKTVHHDHPDFLKLVTDHIQIFERHWRKMVVDIRKGKLDRNLEISPESRLIFESANLPRPQLASKLDLIFRKLGFHKKVLGKDIEIQPFADKKPPKTATDPRIPGRIELVRTPRRNSLRPSISRPGSSAISFGLTAIKGEFSSPPPTASALPGEDRRLVSFRSVASPTVPTRTTGDLGEKGVSSKLIKADSSPVRKSSTGFAESNPNLQSTEKTVYSPSPERSSMRKSSKISKRDLLASLGKSFRSEIDGDGEIQGEGRRTGSAGGSRAQKRRGSHSDIHRPITPLEVDRKNYALQTAPREKYKHVMQLGTGDRYVCPFPACGKSFHSKEAAFRHLPVHEQRFRLSAATPLPDSHMNFFWPKGVPWLAAKKYANRAIPPGSFVCPCSVTGCKDIFPSRSKLETHLRLVHSIVGDSHQSLGYLRFEGTAALIVPPDKPPEGLPVHYCPNHTIPVGTCVSCVEVDAGNGPKPPFQFFPAATLDLNAKNNLPRFTRASKSSQLGGGVNTSGKRRLVTDDWTTGVMVLDKTKSGFQGTPSALSTSRKSDASTNRRSLRAKENVWRGRAVALVQDRDRNGWVAVERLCTYQEALSKGAEVSVEPIHSDFALFRPTLYLEEEVILNDLDGFFQWVPVAQVVGFYSLKVVQELEDIDHLLKPNVAQTVQKIYHVFRE